MSRGRFYARLEVNECSLLDDLEGSAPFDAAIITDRYLAPFPEGSSETSAPDALARSVVAAGRPFAVDPDTARLAQADSAKRQSQRSAMRPVANCLPLPLTEAALRGPEAIRAMVDAAAISQALAGAFAAPYLEISGPSDPRVAVNVALLRASHEVAGGRPLIAYLQFLPTALVSGNAFAAARKIAPHADVVAIRVRRLKTADVTPREAQQLVALVADLAARNVRVIADCAGPAGPPLVAAGADAYSTGSHHFRSVPDDLHPTTGGGGGAPLYLYSSVGSGASTSSGLSPIECETNSEIRLANFRTSQEDAREAGALGVSYEEVLRSSGTRQGQIWATALRQLRRRAA